VEPLSSIFISFIPIKKKKHEPSRGNGLRINVNFTFSVLQPLYFPPAISKSGHNFHLQSPSTQKIYSIYERFIQLTLAMIYHKHNNL